MSAPLPDWLVRLLAGDRATLARAITAVENESPLAGEVLRSIHPHLGKALVVGFTGPPGAGKSTLINAYLGELRKRGMSVGVVAVDPSSPISGGAILGDRIRMGQHAGDEGVFVRSLASRGHLGGLSRTAARVIDVMDAAGKNVIVVETVGTGQSEVEVAEIAQTKVVVAAPGMGDDIQAIKAGILEIADIFVVNKSDLPLADYTARHLSDLSRSLIRHGDWRPPVVRTIATEEKGMEELADAVIAHAVASGGVKRSPLIRARRLIATQAAHRLHDLLVNSQDARLDELCDRLLKGEVDLDDAAEKAIRLGGD
jgi:LAO/AO transport system kinase